MFEGELRERIKKPTYSKGDRVIHHLPKKDKKNIDLLLRKGVGYCGMFDYHIPLTPWLANDDESFWYKIELLINENFEIVKVYSLQIPNG